MLQVLFVLTLLGLSQEGEAVVDVLCRYCACRLCLLVGCTGMVAACVSCVASMGYVAVSLPLCVLCWLRWCSYSFLGWVFVPCTNTVCVHSLLGVFVRCDGSARRQRMCVRTWALY
jgi:hypothetical protein